MDKTKFLFLKLPSRTAGRDRVFAPTAATLQSLPPRRDLRELPGAFPAVFMQGQLNSCSANAVAAALHYAMYRRCPATAFCPSRLFIYYNERRAESALGLDACYGRPVQLRTCLLTVATEGVCAEELWPYDAFSLDQRPPDAAYAQAQACRGPAYHRVVPELAHLKACLASGFPFLFGARLYPNFPRYGSTGNSTVRLPTALQVPVSAHALLAVGYDDGQGVFIVRNSWGSEWGNGGHCYFPYEYLINPDWAFDHWVIEAPPAADDPTPAAVGAPAAASLP